MTTSDQPACGVPWPVCPDCPGEGLETLAGLSWCPRCGRQWPAADVEPCPWPATVELLDIEGESRRVCESHATHPAAGRLAKDTDRQ